MELVRQTEIATQPKLPYLKLNYETEKSRRKGGREGKFKERQVTKVTRQVDVTAHSTLSYLTLPYPTLPYPTQPSLTTPYQLTRQAGRGNQPASPLTRRRGRPRTHVTCIHLLLTRLGAQVSTYATEDREETYKSVWLFEFGKKDWKRLINFCTGKLDNEEMSLSRKFCRGEQGKR